MNYCGVTNRTTYQVDKAEAEVREGKRGDWRLGNWEESQRPVSNGITARGDG